MGNTQARTNGPRKKRLGWQRRLSEPHSDYSENHLRVWISKMSTSGAMTPVSASPPRIQINGMDSTEETEELNTPKKYSIDISSTSSSGRHRSALLRRMQFLNSSIGNVSASSLDESQSVEKVRLKPLSRAKSHSPLKQMRTYSYRSLNSEENALDKTACDLIKSSWHEATIKANTAGHDFGYFVFQRIFQKDPSLKTAFGLKMDEEISDLTGDHECIRHSKIFTNIIHLAAKNVDELEPQVAPAIFKYGERHYTTKASGLITEESVRMVCAQVVCTVCDLLGDEAQPQCVEAWIEMMRYLGRKLLDGFEYAKLTSKHRISINRNDHHLFLTL